MLIPRELPQSVRNVLPTMLDRPVRRARHSRNIGTINLPLSWRLIVYMRTREPLELCSHERYNRVLDAWCARR